MGGDAAAEPQKIKLDWGTSGRAILGNEEQFSGATLAGRLQSEIAAIDKAVAQMGFSVTGKPSPQKVFRKPVLRPATL